MRGGLAFFIGGAMSSKLEDLITSYVRTLVPVVVIYVAGLLSKMLGVESDQAQIQSIIDSLQGTSALIAVAIYYAAVRAAEEKWPWIGILLGVRKTPIYKL